jgi:drug/metabolite transporter (DMT)-like permease
MTPMRWLAAVIGVLGLLAVIGGILYFATPAHSLPSFLGPLPRVNAHRKRRGEAAIAIAVVLWVIAGIVLFVERRQAAGPAASGSPGAGAAPEPQEPSSTSTPGSETP